MRTFPIGSKTLGRQAVADIEGATGMAIIRAIVGGERDPTKLAQLRNTGCRKSESEIAEQLSGHWRQNHLFSLAQHLQMYDAIAERILAYEKEILRRLAELEQSGGEGAQPPKLKNSNKAKMIRQRGEEPLRQAFLPDEWSRFDSH